MTTLSTARGRKGKIQIVIANIKPPLNQIKDLQKLIHLVVHTYHPDNTERKNVPYQIEQTNTFF